MDFTFLFIIVLMLLAVKNGIWWIAAGLFIVLLVTSKSKYLLFASVIGGVLAALVFLTDLGEYRLWVIVGGLFVVLVLISRKEAEHPTPDQYGMGGGM